MKRVDPKAVKTLVGELVQAKKQLHHGAVEHVRENHVRTQTFGEQRIASDIRGGRFRDGGQGAKCGELPKRLGSLTGGGWCISVCKVWFEAKRTRRFGSRVTWSLLFAM